MTIRVGNLGQCGVEHADVIGDDVACRRCPGATSLLVPPGVVQQGDHRAVAEGVLERRCPGSLAERWWRRASGVPIASSTRQHVESDATAPRSPACSTNTAMSEIVYAPSATAIARSPRTRPGSWRPRARRSPLRPSESSPLSVVRSAKSASNRDPAWGHHHTPHVGSNRDPGTGRCAFTAKVPFLTGILVLQQAQFSVAAGHFRLYSPGHDVKIMKSSASGSEALLRRLHLSHIRRQVPELIAIAKPNGGTIEVLRALLTEEAASWERSALVTWRAERCPRREDLSTPDRARLARSHPTQQVH